jgi:tetratricopeptide (TPR) repeat protein|tara:strand:+ start:429 stop:923 length:495 start_codon:yes stop_codon:yes gene_type:complete
MEESPSQISLFPPADYYQEASSFEKRGLNDKARELYNLAARKGQNKYQALLSLAQLDTKMGNWVQALDHFVQASRQYPDGVEADLGLGVLYLQNRDYHLAQGYLNSAKENGISEASYYLGCALIGLKKTHLARGFLEDYVSMGGGIHSSDAAIQIEIIKGETGG